MPLEFKKMAVTCCLAFKQGFDQSDTKKVKDCFLQHKCFFFNYQFLCLVFKPFSVFFLFFFAVCLFCFCG